MKIADLKNRFQFYAEKHVDIKHNAAVRTQNAFFHLEGEEVQAAINAGIKFPCLLLQTPEAEKDGPIDGMSELMEFTYVVLKKLDNGTKAVVLDECKVITDDIFNLILDDFINDTLPGAIAGSHEGIVGPLADKLYGWGVSISLSDAYNAEVNPAKWLHLNSQED